MAASVFEIIFPVLKSYAVYTGFTQTLWVGFCSVIYWANALLLMHTSMRGDLAHGYEFMWSGHFLLDYIFLSQDKQLYLHLVSFCCNRRVYTNRPRVVNLQMWEFNSAKLDLFACPVLCSIISFGFLSHGTENVTCSMGNHPSVLNSVVVLKSLLI